MENDIVVKSNLPRSASVEEKLKDITEQLKRKYQDKKIYFYYQLEKENRSVNFETVRKWIKQIYNMDKIAYFVSVGVLSPMEIFDLREEQTDICEIKGKRCAVFSYYNRVAYVEDWMKKAGALIVPWDSENIDFIFYDYRNDEQRICVYKNPQDKNTALYTICKRMECGNLKCKVLSSDFLMKLKEFEKNGVMSKEERENKGVFAYGKTQKKQIPYVFENHIDLQKIPRYIPSAIYWSLSYFYDWFECTDGEIRGGIENYTSEDSCDSAEKIKSAFDRFKKLCNGINEPDVKEYIVNAIQNTKAENGVEVVIASVGYIDSFEECLCMVAKLNKKDVITVSLKKVKLISRYDGNDYKLTNKLKEGTPSALIFKNADDDFIYRDAAGYIWVDSESSALPEKIFANDPQIKYVELSDRIWKIGFGAFANCQNLEAIKFGKYTNEIDVSAFKNCRKLKRVCIPAHVKSIAGACFENCLSLEEVIFQDGSVCEGIDERAFLGCTQLRKINLPNSLQKMAKTAFEGCDLISELSNKYK